MFEKFRKKKTNSGIEGENREQWEIELEDSVADYLDEHYSSSLRGTAFDYFKARNPYYLVDLEECIKKLYTLYDRISKKRYSKLKTDETILRLGFGMLMRHALEAISVDLMVRNHIDPNGKSVYERLQMLKGQIVPGYNQTVEQVLIQALNLTNEIAHPHVTTDVHSYAELHEFYKTLFEPVLLVYMEGASKLRFRRYLKLLHKRLSKFSVKDKITRTLIQGCLVRQLTECVTNRWCYNKELVPTDDSTKENQISISLRLTNLNQIVRDELAEQGHCISALDRRVIQDLFAIKNASNRLMHVTADHVSVHFLKQNGKELRNNHGRVVGQCSPGALDMKFDVGIRRWRTFLTTILCGLLGWTGAHHFYAGNFRKGLIHLLVYGTLIGPTLGGYMTGLAGFTTFLIGLGPVWGLNCIAEGSFCTNRWGCLYPTRFSNFLCKLFTVLHLILLYILIWRR